MMKDEVDKNDETSLRRRFVELEILATQLDHTVGELNTVLIQVQKRLDRLEELAHRLDVRHQHLAESVRDTLGSERNPAEEKPPHY